MNPILTLLQIAKNDGLLNWDLTHNGIHYTQTQNFEHKSKKKRNLLWKISIPLFLIIIAITTYGIIIKTRVKPLPSIPVLTSSSEIINIIIDQKNPQKLEFFLTKWKYQDVVDEYGWTPLHWACFLENDQLITILQKNGASMNAKSTKDWFAFPTGSTPMEIKQVVRELRFKK